MVHMYRDHVYEEYGRVDPLPEGYTISAVYPLLDVAVECGDEKEMDEENVQQPDTESQQEGSEEVTSQETALQETSELSTEQSSSHPISESEMDDQLLHLCIRVSIFTLTHIQCFSEIGPEELPIQTSTFNSKYLNQKEFISSHRASDYCSLDWLQ